MFVLLFETPALHYVMDRRNKRQSNSGWEFMQISACSSWWTCL